MKIKDIRPSLPLSGYISIATEGEGDDLRTLGHLKIEAMHHAEPNEGEATPVRAVHPIVEKLEKSDDQIKAVPIRCFFNNASRAVSAKFEAYDKETGLCVCSGDGERAVRADGKPVNCPGAKDCAIASAIGAECALRVQMPVYIRGDDNLLRAYLVRSSSFQSFAILQGQLSMLERVFGGLRGVPLKLELTAKSGVASGYRAYHLLSLGLAGSVEDCRTEATAFRGQFGSGDDVAFFDEGFDSTFALQEPEAAPTTPVGDSKAQEGAGSSVVKPGSAMAMLQSSFNTMPALPDPCLLELQS